MDLFSVSLDHVFHLESKLDLCDLDYLQEMRISQVTFCLPGSVAGHWVHTNTWAMKVHALDFGTSSTTDFREIRNVPNG